MTDTAKPMGTQSLGIGSIIGESFSLTFKNFLKFLLLVIVPIIVISLVGYLMFSSVILQAWDAMLNLTAQEDLEREIIANWVTYLVMYIVFIVIAMLVYSFAYAAGLYVAVESKLGRPANIGQAFAVGLSATPALFTVQLVLGLLLAIVLGLISYVFIEAGLDVVGQIVTLVLILYYYGLLMPLGAVVTIEKSWFSAIDRSLRLTAGYRWWIVLMMILFGLAMVVAMLGFGLVGFLMAQIGGTVGAVLLLILYLVAITVIFGVGVAIVALTYGRLREIKEGTSLESMADVFE